MITPVTIGPTMPERLPMQFWTPTHLPAARGPASVWAAAKICGLASPNPAPDAKRQARASASVGAKAQAIRLGAAIRHPPPSTVLRARLGLAPAATQRSVATPPRNAAAAKAR